MDRYDNWMAIAKLREKWDSFVESVGGDLFSSFDWCEVWWKHFGFGRRLEVCVVRSGDEWVALFPMFRETLFWGPIVLRVIRVLGCDHCVTTCGVPIRRGFESQAISRLFDQLSLGDPWDVLQFGELAGYAESSGDLADAIQSQGPVGETTLQNDCYPHMIFDVPRDLDAFLAQLSIKERRNVRKDQRDLEAAGAKFVMPATQDELRSAFDRLVAMHEAQWRIRGRGGHFGDWPGSEAFHREFASRALSAGRLALIEVQTNDGIVASEYAVRFGSRMHWIIGARAEGVSSRIGYLALLEQAWKNGATLIDALPGYYDYKRRLGARVVCVKDVLAVRDDDSSRRRFRLHRGMAEAISFAYGRAWWWHVAPWLSKRMPHLFARGRHRPQWTRYIRTQFLATRERPKEPSAIDARHHDRTSEGIVPQPGDRE